MISFHAASETLKPNRMRWNPLPLDADNKDFVEGLVTYCGAGTPEMKSGLAVHMYTCSRSMQRRAFCNSDGEMLIVPQEGTLLLKTELGLLRVPPGHICVIPRGVRFLVQLTEEGKAVRGYICEIFQSSFILPDLGPIGSNGLANPRDFETPVAWYEIEDAEWQLVQKFGGSLFEAALDHSPFDVVAWHGNYVPYRYDLARFCAINSVTFDHLDPCTFVVLTAPSGEPGVAVCDFVIFPPRYMVQEHTFRPPYFHRNCMSEFMGNIRGVYEAKLEGFLPGGATLHSIMAAHGPDAECTEAAMEAELVPVKSDPNALAFMFESTFLLRMTKFALESGLVQENYTDCWQGLQRHFVPPAEEQDS
ncbi:MAG: hypothetical protein MHM6MM_002880 [Cercozoa sp. M6MM]